jgi:hypothetical protein
MYYTVAGHNFPLFYTEVGHNFLMSDTAASQNDFGAQMFPEFLPCFLVFTKRMLECQ